MIQLSDIRDLVDDFKLTEQVYQSKLDAKADKSIGVYHSKHSTQYKVAIGGAQLQSYGAKSVTFLVHWNKSPRETEKAAINLFQKLEAVREEQINNTTIKFIQLLNSEPVDVGTDENGIYEMVIEAAFTYAK